MAKFTKTSKNTITLTSNGKFTDSVNVLKWADNLVSDCNGVKLETVLDTDESAYKSVVVELPAFAMQDLSMWMEMTKPLSNAAKARVLEQYI